MRMAHSALLCSQHLGCFGSPSLRDPPPWMECDLRSCKHIGASTENCLTKSIKADMVPWGGGGRLLCLSTPSLTLPPHLYTLSLSMSSVIFLLLRCFHFIIFSPLALFFFFFLNALSRFCSMHWTARAMALADLPAGLLRGGSFIWALEKPAPGSETAVQTWEWEDHAKGREEREKLQWSSGNRTSPCSFSHSLLAPPPPPLTPCAPFLVLQPIHADVFVTLSGVRL